MRILVFGASGRTGREVVRQALSRGHSVTGFVRGSSRPSVAEPAMQVIDGDVASPNAVVDAIAGQEAVVSCLGVGTTLRHDPKVIAGVRHILAGMRTHGVRRLVYQSFIGVRESRSAVGFLLRYVAPLPLRQEIGDHEVKESLVRTSDTDWTIVRPPTLTNGKATEAYRAGEAISTWAPVSFLSRADVAHFIVQELENPAYVKKAVRLLP
jgi:putative NADH-flavin reductase